MPSPAAHATARCHGARHASAGTRTSGTARHMVSDASADTGQVHVCSAITHVNATKVAYSALLPLLARELLPGLHANTFAPVSEDVSYRSQARQLQSGRAGAVCDRVRREPSDQGLGAAARRGAVQSRRALTVVECGRCVVSREHRRVVFAARVGDGATQAAFQSRGGAPAGAALLRQ